MELAGSQEAAIDTNILNWLAFQGLENEVQTDPNKLQDYEAIIELFHFQEQGLIILAGPDQVYREAMQTPSKTRRDKLLHAWDCCKRKYNLTRFPINLKNGAYWMTEDAESKFAQYAMFAETDKEHKDLEVLASVAIAGFIIFITVDYDLLSNNRVRDFILEKDSIRMYRPIEIVERLKYRL